MKNYPTKLIRSGRRTLAIEITPEGVLVIRAPQRLPEREIRRFLEEKSDWIDAHMRQAAQRRASAPAPLPRFTEDEIRELFDRALQVIPERVRHYAPLVGVTYGRITVRNQKTKWGSCSGKGNLNFNCLLVLAPPEVLDYVVVHELCHRKQMNHSPAFWAEVGRVLPDYEVRKRWLKEHGHALMRRMWPDE